METLPCNCDAPNKNIMTYRDTRTGKVFAQCEWCGNQDGKEYRSRNEARKGWNELMKKEGEG